MACQERVAEMATVHTGGCKVLTVVAEVLAKVAVEVALVEAMVADIAVVAEDARC